MKETYPNIFDASSHRISDSRQKWLCHPELSTQVFSDPAILDQKQHKLLVKLDDRPYACNFMCSTIWNLRDETVACATWISIPHVSFNMSIADALHDSATIPHV